MSAEEVEVGDVLAGVAREEIKVVGASLEVVGASVGDDNVQDAGTVGVKVGLRARMCGGNTV